ncbi:MAG: DUF6471 domain-containing protein [Sulfuricurvum sp.]|nr:DUF6471 domain-containing protein [Sulfuricurvum sp.]MDD5387558.1 DUF6471 domain-containing protein [Sulfuricurvum sp.]
MPEEYWNEQAKGILKAQLARRNMRYHDLALALQAMGLEENQNTIATKLSRGTFSFAFFIQCMYALRMDSIELNLNPYSEDQ